MVGHGAGESCVLLREAGLRRVSLTNSQIGSARYYKGVTLGKTLSSASPNALTSVGVGLMPFAPVDSRVTWDGSNNATITWRRRSRLSVRMVGSLGISVPLGESVEAYEVDILTDASDPVVLRTITASSETCGYSAADATADGLTPGLPFNRRIYQMSSSVGRGYVLEAF